MAGGASGRRMTVLTVAVPTHIEQDVRSLLQDRVGGRLCDCAVIEVIPVPCGPRRWKERC